MKQGNFTTLAKDYVNRPGYSADVLGLLAKQVAAEQTKDFKVADVGAGTGKLTENLVALGLSVVAVEPNDAMREEGMRYTEKLPVEWRKGSGEETGLPASSVDWLLMGSSFHWVDLKKGLSEFHRVIRPGGYFTAVWNPRDISSSELHKKIESRIYEIVPELNRVSSGSGQYTKTLFSDLVSTGQFSNVIFVEAKHTLAMSPERYLGAWRSVNDIQAQAGPARFEQVINAIQDEIKDLAEVVVPYKTRAWTAKRVT